MLNKLLIFLAGTAVVLLLIWGTAFGLIYLDGPMWANYACLALLAPVSVVAQAQLAVLVFKEAA